MLTVVVAEENAFSCLANFSLIASHYCTETQVHGKNRWFQMLVILLNVYRYLLCLYWH